MTTEELKQDLEQFCGTEEYYRFNALMRNVLLTEGTRYLAQEANAFWLMDVIGSHLPSGPKDESFVVALLERHDGGWKFTLNDDIPPSKIYAEQRIEFSNFPLDEIKLYAQFDGKYWVIMLPGEY